MTSRFLSTNRRRTRATRPSLELLEERCLLSANLLEAYGQLPLSFEANQGQTHAAVDFLSRGDGYSLFLQPTEAVVTIQPGDAVSMKLLGADPAAKPHPLTELAGRSNYLLGNDPSQWLTNIPTYSKVAFDDVYKDVDVAYYGNQRQLEYDFIVAPGAHPNDIHLQFDGVQRMRLDADGNLI